MTDQPTQASGLQVPEIAVKEGRRVLSYASDGLNGKIECLEAAQLEDPNGILR